MKIYLSAEELVEQEKQVYTGKVSFFRRRYVAFPALPCESPTDCGYSRTGRNLKVALSLYSSFDVLCGLLSPSWCPS
jgi:hypothetical protein